MKETISFVIVYYTWWMDRGYFEEEVVEAESYEAAASYAASKCHNNRTTFKHWDYRVVKATKNIAIEPIPRKLTWIERITGRVN
jgi:hypothetical protein